MRSEFPSQVRKDAWKRCEGNCEECGCKLFPGQFDYDHDTPDGLGGLPTLSNCKVRCKSCHGIKTHTIDRPIMQKADNIRAKHFGLGAKKKPWPKPLDPWRKGVAG